MEKKRENRVNVFWRDSKGEYRSTSESAGSQPEWSRAWSNSLCVPPDRLLDLTPVASYNLLLMLLLPHNVFLGQCSGCTCRRYSGMGDVVDRIADEYRAARAESQLLGTGANIPQSIPFDLESSLDRCRHAFRLGFKF
jgi:hypothetical protein